MDTIDSIIAFAESPLLDFILKGVLIYLAILWFAMVVWVARDVINRSNNILFQVVMILLNIILPIFGLVLYLIIRPSRTLLEKYYDELEYSFLNDHAMGDDHCERCEEKLLPDFLYCPSCAEKVRNSCSGCKHVYLSKYVVCPYCGKKGKSNVSKKEKTSSKKKSKKNKEKTSSSE